MLHVFVVGRSVVDFLFIYYENRTKVQIKNKNKNYAYDTHK